VPLFLSSRGKKRKKREKKGGERSLSVAFHGWPKGKGKKKGRGGKKKKGPPALSNFPGKREKKGSQLHRKEKVLFLFFEFKGKYPSEILLPA